MMERKLCPRFERDSSTLCVHVSVCAQVLVKFPLTAEEKKHRESLQKVAKAVGY